MADLNVNIYITLKVLVSDRYQEAFEGKWWYKPEYIIGEMNINSAITDPVGVCR